MTSRRDQLGRQHGWQAPLPSPCRQPPAHHAAAARMRLQRRPAERCPHRRDAAHACGGRGNGSAHAGQLERTAEQLTAEKWRQRAAGCSHKPLKQRGRLPRGSRLSAALNAPTCSHHQQRVAALQASHQADVGVEERGKAAGWWGGSRWGSGQAILSSDCQAILGVCVLGAYLHATAQGYRAVVQPYRHSWLPISPPYPSPATRLTSIIAPGPSSASRR